MLAPIHYNHNEIVSLDRTYINDTKFEELTNWGVVYVTKMKETVQSRIAPYCYLQFKLISFPTNLFDIPLETIVTMKPKYEDREQVELYYDFYIFMFYFFTSHAI